MAPANDRIHTPRRSSQTRRQRVGWGAKTAPAWLIALLLASSIGVAIGGSVRVPLAQGAGGTASVGHGRSFVLQPGPDWPTFMGDTDRTASIVSSVAPSPATAGRLGQVWNFSGGGRFLASPAVANGTVFIGAWDGYEYALSASNGSLLWKAYLGLANLTSCTHPEGVTSSATVWKGEVYVGGGDSYWYALNASTGHIDWKVLVGNTSSGYYNYASPLIYHGHAYIGVSSNCDHPLVRGGLLEVSLTTHQIVGTFYTVPSGKLGGSIWSSPAVDFKTNTVFVTTGNPAKAVVTNYSQAIIALNATTLAVESSWQVPANQSIYDGDFGATPTLFHNATGVALVASTNKNGFTYVLRQSNLSLGPVWEAKTSGGGDSVAAAGFANGLLYIAGPRTQIHGGNASGAIRALDPNTWSYVWQTGLWGRAMAAPSIANGLLIAPTAGHWLFLLNATSGAMLRHLSFGGSLFGTVAIYQGLLIFGCANGQVYAYG